MTENQLALLLKAVGDADRLLILPHNNPDPDAIASALALRLLLAEKLEIESDIIYQGIIGRAENRALVRYLGYPLQPITMIDASLALPVALVDTQPNAGNITLPPRSRLVIVLDHHDRQAEPSFTGHIDIRPELGATSTILVEYLQAADLEPDPPLATALFYGLKTNTLGLGRNVDAADTAAYFYLQNRLDVEALAQIEHAQVPASYFKGFDAALRAAQIYDEVVISYLGIMEYPDLTAEIADLLLRLDNSQWVICLGVHNEILILSVRTRRRQGGAGRLIRAIIGDRGTAGGHGAIAGGQMPLKGQDARQLVQNLNQRFLRQLKVSPNVRGQPLV